jgi:hypothetical protein
VAIRSTKRGSSVVVFSVEADEVGEVGGMAVSLVRARSVSSQRAGRGRRGGVASAMAVVRFMG